jgi:hypothetical protein
MFLRDVSPYREPICKISTASTTAFHRIVSRLVPVPVQLIAKDLLVLSAVIATVQPFGEMSVPIRS